MTRMAGTPTLGCQGYTVRRECDALVSFDVRFVLKLAPNDTHGIADALSRLELYLSGDVALVKGGMDTRPRCFYCTSLNDSENTHCASCGAPL